MSIPTSATLASSITLRLRELARRAHALGPKAVHEMMVAVAAGADPMVTFEHFGVYSLHGDPNQAYGNGALPRLLRRIK